MIEVEGEPSLAARLAALALFTYALGVVSGYALRTFDKVVEREAWKIKHENCNRALRGEMYAKGVTR